MDFQPKWLTNYAGDRILALENEEKAVYLDSMYSTEDLLNCWSTQQDISDFGTKIILFGLADGHYALRLHQINPEAKLIIYEPSLELVDLVKPEPSIRELLEKHIQIIVGENDFLLFCRSLSGLLSYEERELVHVFVSPNYDMVYNDMVNTLFEQVNAALVRLEIYRNTYSEMGKDFNRAMAGNIIDFVEQYALCDLIHEFQNENLENIPAIIVSAGPSLDKNIKQLEEAKKNAFIIAVDSAMNPLAQANIRPDIFVTVDPQKPEQIMEDPRTRDVPCAFLLQANPKIREKIGGRRIYHYADFPIVGSFLNKFDKEKTSLPTGGSVANDAYSLARRLGFKTIILIGQDLAYPNRQVHAKESFAEEVISNTINMEQGDYFLVEGYDGQPIYTEHNMNLYRKWFEREVQIHKEIRHINATEGGAKIAGMEQMTLVQAIEECCDRSKEYDFAAIINRIPPQFNSEQRREMFDYLAHFEDNLKDIRHKLREGLSDYERFSRMLQKRNYGTGFQELYKKITELNNWLAYEEDVNFLTHYSQMEEYEAKENVYEKYNSEEEEMLHSVKTGMKLIESKLLACDRAWEDYEQVCKEAKRKLEELVQQ